MALRYVRWTIGLQPLANDGFHHRGTEDTKLACRKRLGGENYMQKIIPHLWFDRNAKKAADFYCTLFSNSKVANLTMLQPLMK
jgi:hypothetical protein